ncbi:MAG: M2 family metallopeptidase [Bacteroidia bacterium]|nr:M2 family metallopeptidase [Bacteroidia bacterium]
MENQSKDMDQELKALIKEIESKYIPLYKESAIADFNANVTGKPEDFKKSEELQMQLNKIFADTAYYAKLKKFKEANAIKNDTLKRELEIYYNRFLESHADTAKLNAITKLQTAITKKYGNFRAKIGKDSVPDNTIEDILKKSTDSKKLEEAWLAHKRIGPVVSADIIRLVKLRNELAKSIGFNNYHEMKLKLYEQDPKDVEKLFDELDNLTRDAFAKLKGEIDDYFIKRYKIKKEELMPWHYQNRYFQEAPAIYSIDLDSYYKGKDIVAITQKYYEGIGAPIDDLIKKSDLFEKPGKNQHAFCSDMDNEGDVRVLCNVKDNERWMNTMLHEYGHAIYDKFIPTTLPFVLRDPAHTFTTEAVAMFFGRLAKNPYWMKETVGIKDEDVKKISDIGFKTLRLEQLTFSRWAQVMYRFEKNMYENPDQDLNKLWWNLVEKYQMLKRPAGRDEPDWATKAHIASYPCYYHNYLMGELLASQFYNYVCEKILKTKDMNLQSYVGNKEMGKFFVEKVFAPGSLYPWNDMIEKATGEKLTARYYAKQFVN